MTKKYNKGFTLMEMIVVIAVTGIFLSLVMVILSSSLNIFDKNKQKNNNFSDTNLSSTIITKYIADVNKEGKDLIYYKLENRLISSDNTYELIITKEDVKTKKIVDDNIINNSVNINDINITITVNEENNSITFSYLENELEIRKNIFYIIGGISIWKN